MDREALIRIHSPDSCLALRSAVVVGNRDKCAGFGELVSRVSKLAIDPILRCRDEQDGEGRLLAHHRKATLPVRRSCNDASTDSPLQRISQRLAGTDLPGEGIIQEPDGCLDDLCAGGNRRPSGCRGTLTRQALCRCSIERCFHALRTSSIPTSSKSICREK